MLLAAAALPAKAAEQNRRQVWKAANGRSVTIPKPFNHVQCMVNGKNMGYKYEETKAHCDRYFPGG